MASGTGVYGFELTVQGLGLWVQGLRFRAKDLEGVKACVSS